MLSSIECEKLLVCYGWFIKSKRNKMGKTHTHTIYTTVANICTQLTAMDVFSDIINAHRHTNKHKQRHAHANTHTFLGKRAWIVGMGLATPQPPNTTISAPDCTAVCAAR